MAESASRAGYEVTALDAFGDLDQALGVTTLSLPRDFGVAFSAAALARISRSVACDVVAYLSPFENHPSSVTQIAEGRTLWGNDAPTLRRARNPAFGATLFGNDGLRTADDDRWLLKPRRSGGGHGIQWMIPGEPVPRGMYAQRFVDGIAGSVVFVAARGKSVPVGLTRQLIGEPAFGALGFRYFGKVLAGAGDPQFARDTELFDAVCRLADVAAREIGLVGVNGIDFVALDGVPFPVEINPRWSASMELVERAYGTSVFELHARACEAGDLPDFDLNRVRTGARAFGKAILFARHDILCDDTRAWLSDASIRDVPHPGEHIPAGRPVCTIFAEAADAVACEFALRQRAATLYAVLDEWAAVPR